MLDVYFTIEKVVADKSNRLDDPKSFDMAIRVRVNAFWLIDFFIPSNIEDMTRQFFQTLAFGNNGDGVFMYFGSIPPTSSNYTLSFGTDAEVLSNGTMKFAHNLQRQMIREENKLVAVIKRFEQQLWKAFYLDFSRMKSIGFCDH